MNICYVLCMTSKKSKMLNINEFTEKCVNILEENGFVEEKKYPNVTYNKFIPINNFLDSRILSKINHDIKLNNLFGEYARSNKFSVSIYPCFVNVDDYEEKELSVVFQIVFDLARITTVGYCFSTQEEFQDILNISKLVFCLELLLTESPQFHNNLYLNKLKYIEHTYRTTFVIIPENQKISDFIFYINDVSEKTRLTSIDLDPFFEIYFRESKKTNTYVKNGKNIDR